MTSSKTIYLFGFDGNVDIDLFQQKAQALNRLDLARFHAISSNQRRRQFLCGRLLLARAASFARNVKISPEEIALKANGCPFLSNYPQLSANISHSHNRIMAACTDLPTLGLDVEWQRENRPLVEMAQRSFGEEFAKRLASLPHKLQLSEFYRAWTEYEARLKANIKQTTPCHLQTWQHDNYQHCVLSSEPFKLVQYMLSFADLLAGG